jgi:hypothetical protein
MLLTSAATVSCASMFNPICTTPACKNMGVMNLRTVVIGRNPGVTVCLPPPLIGLLAIEPSMTAKVFDSTKSIRWVGGIIETWQRKTVRHKPRIAPKMRTSSQGRFSVGGTCDTFFIHGGKRAPTRIRALPEGPNIGLTTGWICVGVKIYTMSCRKFGSHGTKQGCPAPGHSLPIRK